MTRRRSSSMLEPYRAGPHYDVWQRRRSAVITSAVEAIIGSLLVTYGAGRWRMSITLFASVSAAPQKCGTGVPVAKSMTFPGTEGWRSDALSSGITPIMLAGRSAAGAFRPAGPAPGRVASIPPSGPPGSGFVPAMDYRIPWPAAREWNRPAVGGAGRGRHSVETVLLAPACLE